MNLARWQRPRTVEIMAGRQIRCAWDSISRDANSGDGQDFTGLAGTVQLRLRVRVWAANFDSEAPALNRTEVLAHGH